MPATPVEGNPSRVAAPKLTPPKLTPMMRQYLEVKQSHPDCILLFRLGDFYEMFFEEIGRAHV